MAVSQGVLTLRGGATSHAAVVAKGMGKPCVSGCEDMKIDLAKETLTGCDGTVYHKMTSFLLTAVKVLLWKAQLNLLKQK